MKPSEWPRFALLAFACFSLDQFARASSVLPTSTAELVRISDAVFRGEVVTMYSFKTVEGLIFTRTSLRVEEPFKGKFPTVVNVTHRGGRVGGEDDYCGASPSFVAAGDYLMFVTRAADGTLQATEGSASAIRLLPASASPVAAGPDWLGEVRELTGGGVLPGADVTDQAGLTGPYPAAIVGMLNNVNSRFIAPDRGEPIPYLIDAASLPAGISLTQATNAVRQALNAWTAVTSLQFKFEGFQNFGQGADTIASNDEKLRIQLHDDFGRITSANILGIGGRSAFTSPIGPGWDIGGNVAGTEFFKTSRGYVVLKSSNAALQNLSTFTEVLCHEIGHALNLAHSSEVDTVDPVLYNSIMYYQAHQDGRGATLGAYDPPVIDQVYPTNTPPFTFDRMLDVVDAPSTPDVPGVNEVEVRGYDLRGDNLTIETAAASAFNGEFSLVGNRMKYTPAGYFADSERLNPADGAPWDRIYVRVSDGTNASPYASVNVLSLSGDSDEPSDGIPDNWMQQYFGHTAPQAGDKSRATDDADGDGLNNLQEFLGGSDPRNAGSAQRITSFNLAALQFQAKAYDLYELLGSPNLTTWTRVAVPFVPTNASIAVLTSLPQTNIMGVISNPPSSSPQMFFRILKVP